jgi:hypothetical protein
LQQETTRHTRHDGITMPTSIVTVLAMIEMRQPIVVAHDAMPRLSGAIARASG